MPDLLIRSKFRVLFILACLSVSLYALGQDTAGARKSRVVVGIAVGPTLTSASLASYIPYDAAWGSYTSSTMGVGFDASVFVILPLGQTWYFRPELSFTLRSQHQLYSDSKFLDAVLSTSYRDKLTESQVSLGALFGFQVKPVTIEFGPQLGIVTGAVINSVMKTIAYNGTFYQDQQTDFEKDKMANSVVFSMLAGVAKRDLYRNFGAGIYYSLGLTDVTQYYQLRQITKVHGFTLKLTLTL